MSLVCGWIRSRKYDDPWSETTRSLRRLKGLTTAGTTKGPRVFVDAKITSRHLKDAPKRTIVAYVVDGEDKLKNATDVKADETDDAELHAIAFAIHDLKDKLPEFTVICDNESVVSVIMTENQRTARKRPILSQLLAEKRENSGVQVELLENNPAHKFLNKWLTEHPSQ